MVGELKRHIEKKIAKAVLERSPFPHLVIENFFPADVYGKILAFNPFKGNRGEEWQSAAAAQNTSSKTPYQARKQINFHTNARFEADPEASAFWTQLKSIFLADDWFERVIQKKYRDYFSIRFGDLEEEPNFFSHFRKELFLQRHEPGYYIGPHTDIPSRVFTCIFSFASRPGFEEFGTELVAHKDKLVRCWGNDHYAPDEFVVRKIAPYKPNNFLLFFKTRQSFHAVKAITDEVPDQRYGMQFQLYEPREGVFNDLSAPDLISTNNFGIAKRGVARIAKTDTFLKRSTQKAASLSPAEKLLVSTGQTVESKRQEVVGDHIKLSDVTVDGHTLPGAWYIYAASWGQSAAR